MRQRKINSSRKATTKVSDAQSRESCEECSLPRPLQLAKREQIVAPNVEDVTEVMNFIENYKRMLDPRYKKPSKLISIKIPEPLLEAFRFKAGREKIPYQTKLKHLMMEYLERAG
jgi:predicted DNA binding CopG/RHH family protein